MFLTGQVRQEDVIREGWVEKQSKVLCVWRRRWLVLTPRFLFTFKAQKGGSEFTEAIRVAQCVKVEALPDPGGQRYGFCVETRTRIFNFKTSSEAERSAWLRDILQARKGNPVNSTDGTKGTTQLEGDAHEVKRTAYRVTNAFLKSEKLGIFFCNTPYEKDQDVAGEVAEFGQEVWGVQHDSDWIKVGNSFLPVRVTDCLVLVQLDERDVENEGLGAGKLSASFSTDHAIGRVIEEHYVEVSAAELDISVFAGSWQDASRFATSVAILSDGDVGGANVGKIVGNNLLWADGVSSPIKIVNASTFETEVHGRRCSAEITSDGTVLQWNGGERWQRANTSILDEDVAADGSNNLLEWSRNLEHKLLNDTSVSERRRSGRHLEKATRALRRGSRLAAASMAIVALTDALKNDGDAGVREEVASSLWSVCGPQTSSETVQALCARLSEDAAPGVRKMAAVALGQASGAQSAYSVDALRHALETEQEPTVRRCVASALGHVGDAAMTAAGALQRRLESDDDEHVRARCAEALGGLGCVAPIGSEAARRATAALPHALVLEQSLEARRAVARSVGMLDPTSAASIVGALHMAVQSDSDPEVRRTAAACLGRFGASAGPRAVPGLRKALLRDSDADVRRFSAVSLAQLGEAAAEPAANALRAAFREEPQITVRYAVEIALGQLGAELPRVGLPISRRPSAPHVFSPSASPIARRLSAQHVTSSKSSPLLGQIAALAAAGDAGGGSGRASESTEPERQYDQESSADDYGLPTRICSSGEVVSFFMADGQVKEVQLTPEGAGNDDGDDEAGACEFVSDGPLADEIFASAT